MMYAVVFGTHVVFGHHLVFPPVQLSSHVRMVSVYVFN